MDRATIAAANLQRLRENRYPGRGIILGLDAKEAHYLQVYWIMGRSENSRNRVFVREQESVRTAPLDATKVADASLIIYTALRTVGAAHIVTNGDQTDTITEHLRDGSSFEAALRTRRHEPDPPNFTPRISGLIDLSGAPPRLVLSKITASPFGDPDSAHCFYEYPEFAAGFGVCVHTYAADGNPLPPFSQDPYLVPLPGTLPDIASLYWSALDGDNRVALAAKSISRRSGETELCILNRHLGD